MLTVNLRRNDPTAPPTRRRSGVMAHRRRLISTRTTVLVCGGLVLVALLVGMVDLSNRVTTLRRSIADLEDARAYQEARAAQLLRAWNEAAAPDIVCARAEHELGLIRPQEPETVLVVDPMPRSNDAGRWLRLLGEWTGAEPALAQDLTSATSRDRP